MILFLFQSFTTTISIQNFQTPPQIRFFCNVKQTITCSLFHNIVYCVKKWIQYSKSSETSSFLSSLSTLTVWQCGKQMGLVYSVNKTFFRLNTLTKETSEGDGWWESSKVDKDDSSNNLSVQSISDVTDIVLIPSLHVSNHATEWNSSTC